MIIEKDELVELYSGIDDIPGQWLSVDEVAERLNQDVGEVRELFKFYGINERPKEDEALRVVWNVLAGEWYMSLGEDFHYPAAVGRTEVHFLIEADGIGFFLDPGIPPKTLEMFHIHGVNIFRFNPNEDPEVLAEHVRKALKDSRVNKRSRRYGKSKDPEPW